ncbi:hypothetical protein BHQ17_26260, partial [Mycolicibacterium holsaticum]
TGGASARADEPGGDGGTGGAGGGAGNGGDGVAPGDGGNGGDGGDGGDGGVTEGDGGFGGAFGAGGLGGEGTDGSTGADGDSGATGANGSRGASVVTAALASAPRLPSLQSLLTNIGRQLSYIFFNRAPSVSPDIGAQTGDDKQITVDLNANGNNGFGVTYTIKEGPRYGTLEPGDTPGSYIYTANEALIRPGITDHFIITIDNGASARLPGFAGAIQGMFHGLAVRIGAAKPDTIDQVITVEVRGNGQYGDYEDAKQYWVSQSYYNCVLQASAAAVGQATQSTPPTEEYMVMLAKTTDSVATPGQKMYLHENIEEGVAGQDAAVLMEKYFDVTATYKRYGTYDDNGQRITAATVEEGQEAFRELQAALAEGKAVVVAYPVAVVWTAVTDFVPGPKDKYTEADHAAVVTQVDMKRGIVYVNDSSMTNKGKNVGQGKALPIGVFMSGWQAADYEMTIVAAKTPDAAAPGVRVA